MVFCKILVAVLLFFNCGSFVWAGADTTEKEKIEKPKDYKFEAVQPGQQDVLKSGDVVKSVNGKPVDSPEAAMKMYEELKKSGKTSIIVERDGKRKKINVDKSKMDKEK